MGILLASIVFPAPGGPTIRILCPPAAAISMALFACSCPLTSEKSIEKSRESLKILFMSVMAGGIFLFPFKNSTTSASVFTGIISILFTMAASAAFSSGRIMPDIFFSLPATAMGRAPLTGLTLPSRESSPRKI